MNEARFQRLLVCVGLLGALPSAEMRNAVGAHYLVAGSGPDGTGCFPHPKPSSDSAKSALPCVVVLEHVRVDDWVFGVAAVSKDMWVSPVASAVPGGAFKPYVAPPPKP